MHIIYSLREWSKLYDQTWACGHKVLPCQVIHSSEGLLSCYLLSKIFPSLSGVMSRPSGEQQSGGVCVMLTS